MKKSFSFVILVLISVQLLAGCSNTMSSGEPITNGSASNIHTDNNSSTETEQTQQTASSLEELALTTYSSFLLGDSTLLDEAQSETWWIPDFQDESMEYEYTYLDLDGDDIAELIIQMADAPCDYNGVFHFENGKIFCWNSDAVEMSCWDYPLNDGTMVRQYHTNGSRSYTIFRYTSNGKTEDILNLFMREELVPEDSAEPCPYYEIDGKEVSQTVFVEQLDAWVTGRMLERSAWMLI